MSVIIKTFTTPGGKYVYDRSTHKLLRISDNEFPAFIRIENNTQTDEDLNVLKRYQEHGFCLENEIEEIEHPGTTLIEYNISLYSVHSKKSIANLISFI